jgi:hypothetical protein
MADINDDDEALQRIKKIHIHDLPSQSIKDTDLLPFETLEDTTRKTNALEFLQWAFNHNEAKTKIEDIVAGMNLILGNGGGGGTTGGTGSNGNKWYTVNLNLANQTLNCYISQIANAIENGVAVIQKDDFVLSTQNANYYRVTSDVLPNSTLVVLQYIGSLSIPPNFTVPEFLTFQTLSEANTYFSQNPSQARVGLHFVVKAEEMLYKIETL